MGLPTIKVPKFTLNLPVSKMEIKARPFLIKEQKMLLQAMEIGDADQVTMALDEIMTDCTFNEVNIDELPVPDVEYLMLHLRSKSVGEEIKMTYTCHNLIPDEDKKKKELVDCGSRINLKININSVKIKEFDNHRSTLVFDGGIGIELRDIPYGVYKKIITEKESLSKTMTLRNSCVKSVFDKDRVWTRKEFNDEDLNDFIDNLYTNDYEKIEAFIKTMPILEHTVQLICPNCGHKETITLKGLDDFLG